MYTIIIDIFSFLSPFSFSGINILMRYRYEQIFILSCRQSGTATGDGRRKISFERPKTAVSLDKSIIFQDGPM